MHRKKYFGGRGAVALAALALAVQASLPMFLAVELHVHAVHALAIELPQTVSAAVDHVAAGKANSLDPHHHCTCPVCQILAAGQLFPLASQQTLGLPHTPPNALIALESAPLLPVSLPSSYQARAPPFAG